MHLPTARTKPTDSLLKFNSLWIILIWHEVQLVFVHRNGQWKCLLQFSFFSEQIAEPAISYFNLSKAFSICSSTWLKNVCELYVVQTNAMLDISLLPPHKKNTFVIITALHFLCAGCSLFMLVVSWCSAAVTPGTVCSTNCSNVVSLAGRVTECLLAESPPQNCCWDSVMWLSPPKLKLDFCPWIIL